MLKWLNPFVVGYLLIYGLNLFYTSTIDGFPLEESLGILIVVGFGFSSIAWVASRKATPLVDEVPEREGERMLLTGLVVFLALTIIAGNKPLEFLLPGSLQDDGNERSVISLVRKVITFVVIPFLVYRRLYGFRAADFGLSTEWRKVFSLKNTIIFVVMSAVVLSLNYFGGNGAKPIRDGLLSSNQLMIGIPLLLIWDYIEVGLVEEFFFRGLLQNRLAAVLKSPWGAIFISALIFGLVHAPGMYLRGAGAIEGLGTEPTLLATVSYSIAIQSAAGIFFGIIWYKTRNLWLLMGIHAMMDLLPHLAEFVADWGIGGR